MDQPVKLESLAEIELWSMAYAAALGVFISQKSSAPGDLAEGRADIAVLGLRERCAPKLDSHMDQPISELEQGRRNDRAWVKLVHNATLTELQKWCEPNPYVAERLPGSVWECSEEQIRRAIFQWLAEGPAAFPPHLDPPLP